MTTQQQRIADLEQKVAGLAAEVAVQSEQIILLFGLKGLPAPAPVRRLHSVGGTK